MRDSYPESKIKAISIQNANVTGPQFFNLFHRTDKNRMQIISKVVTGVVIGLSEPSIDGISRGIFILARGEEYLEECGQKLERNAFYN